LDGAIIKEAYELQSIYIENIGNNKFNTHALPIEANFSPVMSIESKDLNKDGLKDIILAGNFYGFMPGVGRQDASQGYLLLNGGNNSFLTVEHTNSGILLEGEVKEMKWIRLSNGREGLIIARNNEDIVILEIKK
jgi:hypothetical protein